MIEGGILEAVSNICGFSSFQLAMVPNPREYQGFTVRPFQVVLLQSQVTCSCICSQTSIELFINTILLKNILKVSCLWKSLTINSSMYAFQNYSGGGALFFFLFGRKRVMGLVWLGCTELTRQKESPL